MASRKSIERCDLYLPLLSVSQYPTDFGTNIVMPLKRSVESMFQQILKGLEIMDCNVVFMLEHDVLYHKSHFDFIPTEDKYYFNTNIWTVNEDGQALYYDNKKTTSGLVAFRRILLEHYREKVDLVNKMGFNKNMGYEPGRKKSRGRPDDYEIKTFKSEHPLVDIKHKGCVTKGRFRLDQYQHGGRRIKDSWVLTDEIPYWGKTRPFDDFLRRWL
jgi:hypothetical protein